MSDKDSAESRYGDYKPGTIVLYKLGRLPPWPATVMEDSEVPPAVMANKPKHPQRNVPILFYQSNDWYWVAHKNLQPFDADDALTQLKERKANKKKLREALFLVLSDMSDTRADEYEADFKAKSAKKQKSTPLSNKRKKKLRQDFVSDDEGYYSPSDDNESVSSNANKRQRSGPDSAVTAKESKISTGSMESSYDYDEDEEEEEVDYELVAVVAKETIKNLIFHPVSKLVGRPNAMESPKLNTVYSPHKLSTNDIKTLDDLLFKMEALKPRLGATDSPNIMAVVENYQLADTMTEFRNHFIRNDIKEVDSMRFEKRADELLKYWWAMQHLYQFN